MKWNLVSLLLSASLGVIANVVLGLPSQFEIFKTGKIFVTVYKKATKAR